MTLRERRMLELLLEAEHQIRATREVLSRTLHDVEHRGSIVPVAASSVRQAGKTLRELKVILDQIEEAEKK